MSQQELLELVLLSQTGDKDAIEQLLFWTYTPVSYLCRKILLNAQAAEEETREVLQLLHRNLHTLQDPELYEKWVCRITAARCMQILPQLHWGSTAREATHPQKAPDITGMLLDETQTICAIDRMVDDLPVDPRICILLHCCAGMSSRSIAQITVYSPDTVKENLSKGQVLLQKMLEAYYDLGTQFSGVTSLQEILHTAMHHGADRDAALPVVYGILGKPIPVPPDPTRGLVRGLSVLAVVLGIAVLLLCVVLGMKLAGIPLPF